MSGVRLYIGGLGGSVDEDVLKKHLATYGTVAQADIKEKKDAEGVIMTRFAYVNIEAPNNQIQQCINTLNGSLWKGSRLKVERARESFMERLQRERAGNKQQKGQQQPTISRQVPVRETQINQVQKPLQSFQNQQVNKRSLVVAEQNNIGGTIKKKKIEKSSSESESESSESDSSDDSDEVHNGIPMFRGTASFALGNENENNKKTDGIVNEKKKHVDKEETFKLKSTEKVKQHGDSGLFKDSMVRSKDKVEEALLSNFKNFSSVWGDSDDEDYAVNNEEESSDDSESESGNEESKMKEEIAEAKEPGFFIDLQPAKVSSMQSGVAHNKSKSAAANEDNEDDGIGDVLYERQNQLDILSNILGKPIAVTEHKADEKKSRQQMKRYDPTLPEHKQYEISREKQQQSTSQELDNTETLKQEMNTDNIEQQTLNQDKYIKVSQNLNFKEKSEGFSLLSMFSQKKADSSEDSDEEDEDELAEASETITSTQNATETAQVHKKKAKFFLNEHDAVIDEGIQWLSQSLTQEICDEFDKIRPELVQVYKTRMVRAKRDAKDSRGRGRGRVRVRGPLRDRQQNKSDQNKNFGKGKHSHQNSGMGMAKDRKFNSNRKFEGRGRGLGKGRGQIQGKG